MRAVPLLPGTCCAAGRARRYSGAACEPRAALPSWRKPSYGTRARPAASSGGHEGLAVAGASRQAAVSGRFVVSCWREWRHTLRQPRAEVILQAAALPTSLCAHSSALSTVPRCWGGPRWRRTGRLAPLSDAQARPAGQACTTCANGHSASASGWPQRSPCTRTRRTCGSLAPPPSLGLQARKASVRARWGGAHGRRPQALRPLPHQPSSCVSAREAECLQEPALGQL